MIKDLSVCENYRHTVLAYLSGGNDERVQGPSTNFSCHRNLETRHDDNLASLIGHRRAVAINTVREAGLTGG